MSAPDPVIREADPADAEHVDALRDAARLATAEQRGGPELLAECAAPTDDSLDRGEVVVLVAMLGDLVGGYLALDIGRPTAKVREVFVRTEVRELGCGDALVGAALERARAAGCTRLDAVALPGDRHTKNLYERAGIVARAIVVSTAL